jgi:hypothetical protein
MTKEIQKAKKETAAVAVNGEEKKIALNADFGTVYTIVRGGQIMAPVRAQMTLYEALGHIYKQQDKYLITASGYKHLNKVAAISLVTPQTVIVDGKPVPNPHIERNPRTKAIESVNIRRMGIGFSPTGNIVVIDKTLFYNIYTYFIQSMQAKMKRVKGCALYGIQGKKPDKGGSWAFFATEPPLGIWVNYEDQAMIDCLEEHTQRQRFGDRMAATIVDRNILKDHPAIGAAQVFAKQSQSGTCAYVTVYGYRVENNPRDISEVMSQAEGGAETKDFEIQAETIEEVSEEEEKAAMEEVTGESKGEAESEAGLFDESKGKK